MLYHALRNSLKITVIMLCWGFLCSCTSGVLSHYNTKDVIVGIEFRPAYPGTFREITIHRIRIYYESGYKSYSINKVYKPREIIDLIGIIREKYPDFVFDESIPCEIYVIYRSKGGNRFTKLMVYNPDNLSE